MIPESESFVIGMIFFALPGSLLTMFPAMPYSQNVDFVSVDKVADDIIPDDQFPCVGQLFNGHTQPGLISEALDD